MRREVAQHAVRPVAFSPDAVDEIGAGEVQQRRGTVSDRCSSSDAASSPSSCSMLPVAVRLRLPSCLPMPAGGQCGRRSLIYPVGISPGDRSPSSTVGGDGTPAHPWRAAARGERSDLREQERVAAGHGRVAAHRPAGGAGNVPDIEDISTMARMLEHVGVRVEHPDPTPGGSMPPSSGPTEVDAEPEQADARLVPAPRRPGGASG